MQIKKKTGRSLQTILNEEIDHWKGVIASDTKNRLVLRVANNNLIRRRTQSRAISRGKTIPRFGDIKIIAR